MARALFLTAIAFGTAVTASSASAQSSAYASADRYGPANAATAAPDGMPASQPSRTFPPGRVLAWPGKVEHPVLLVSGPTSSPAGTASTVLISHRVTPARLRPAVVAQASHAPPAAASAEKPPTRTVADVAAPQPTRAASPAQTVVLAGAPTPGWRPVFASQPAPPAPVAAAPSSRVASTQPVPAVYPAAYAAPPNRALGADRRYGYDPTQDHAVRFYSVARPFGLKPDPAPIPPQFFTASADLSGGDPPGPLPVNHTTATTRAAIVGGSDASSQ